MNWPRRWRARWIWWSHMSAQLTLFTDPARPRPDDAIGFLRGKYVLATKPASAPCRLTADSRYVLWVNGTLVGRGPARSEPSHLTYDTYDIAPLLQKGNNVIAAQCRHYGKANVFWKPAPPVMELGYGSFVFECEAGSELWTSDATWSAMKAPHHPPLPQQWGGPPSVEIVDGRSWPFGWSDPDYDDSHWEPATVLDPSNIVGVMHAEPPTEPYGLLEASRLPQLSERVVTPVSVVGRASASRDIDGNPSEQFEAERVSGARTQEPAEVNQSLAAGETVTFDFGEIVLAHAMLTLDASPDSVIDLACGEDIGEDGRPVIAPRKWTMRYTASGTPEETIEAFDAVGFRYMSVTARSGEANRLRLSARERTFPHPSGPYFRCDDEFLNDVWQAGVRTLDLCSTDAYLDCPGREQRAWLGDAYVHTMISFVCNPLYELAKWNVRLHAQGARSDGLIPMVAAGDLTDTWLNIPDYSLHWVRTIARIVEYTSDTDLAEQLMPTALRALSWFERHRGESGLLENLENWIFIDWAQTERRGNIAAVDSLYALALKDLAGLGKAVGDEKLAASARSRADRTIEAFGRYWDEGRGVYVDAADPGGEPGKRVSEHTNALAILSGCAPEDRWGSMCDFAFDFDRHVRTRTPGDPGPREERHLHQWRVPKEFDPERSVVAAQPFFCHFTHQAMVAAGRRDLLMESIKRWKPLLDRGNGCFEEYWDAPPGMGSRCHAWSATPTFDLSTHVLGVRPLAPGFSEFTVDPHLGELSHAEGAVPTPKGLIRVSVKAGSEAEVEAPADLRRI